MRNWQRAHGTIALFMKRHQNNWRITLDFKSQWQLQDNYPKWCNCHSYSVCGRTYTAFVPFPLNAMMKTGLHIVRGNSHLYSPLHDPYSYQPEPKWKMEAKALFKSFGTPCVACSKVCCFHSFNPVLLWISMQAQNLNPTFSRWCPSAKDTPHGAVGSHFLWRKQTLLLLTVLILTDSII